MKANTAKSIYHPDIRIFLVAIPLISAFNYYLTYTNIQPNGFLLLTFTIDTIMGNWKFNCKIQQPSHLNLPLAVPKQLRLKAGFCPDSYILGG
jgi:hypothetical protein